LLPDEFAAFSGMPEHIALHDARESPKSLHALLAGEEAVVLSGPYAYADAVLRYCQHYERHLVPKEKFHHIADLGQRNAAFREDRRRKLHRLFFILRGEQILKVTDPPDTTGFQEWLQEATGDQTYLIPVRRFQRILTDMQRAKEGIFIRSLGDRITILPHVYVPSDESVPRMFGEYAESFRGKYVLDMGTGTGILALLAAKYGADRVVATDSNPNAVANARLNAERLGLQDTIEVRGPGDLFAPVEGEAFDLILFNAPWILGKAKTLYDTANYDEGYRVIDGFIHAFPDYLASGGKALLQYSNISQRKGDDSIAHINETLQSNGLCIASSHKIARISRVLSGSEHVFIFEIGRQPAGGSDED